jgi:phenylpropionate dioxygenase-like ring-hydroxylating dioxygenase large terminal subunit
MATFLKTTESFAQGARTMPREYYVSPEIFAEERERITRAHWICVGREEEIAEPGTFVVREIAGESLILVRDRKEGVARALYNVCRHRGTRLCEAAAGTMSETIQCPYHAWTYALDGRLLGAPHMNEAKEFDKAHYPLHQAALAMWEGFLFVNLARDPEPFAGTFAPMLGRLARFGLDRLKLGRRIVYDVKANWKLIFQNYSECLHCPMIHPELSSKMPYTSGENDLTSGPFLGGFMVIAEPNASLTVTGRFCALPLGNAVPEEAHRAYYYTLFPNLMLSIHPDYAVAYTVWPISAGESRVVCEWLFNPDSFGRPDFNPDDAVEFWDLTNRQDWHISEQSWAGISSRVYTPGPYSPRESIPAAWDRAYLDVMR